MSKSTTFLWRLRTYAARRLVNTPLVGRPFARVNNVLFARKFVPDLQLFHDVLEQTDLAGKYWVWAGMLLGWAREGNLLAHDRDADFAILPDDLPRLLAAVPELERAGFKPLMQFRNNAGSVTELTLRKHGAKFEFFIFEPTGEFVTYYAFGGQSGVPQEVEARVLRQPLVPFEFVGRTWLRPDDYESELACMYGNWRVPQTDWDYLTEDLAVVARRTWTNTDTSWKT